MLTIRCENCRFWDPADDALATVWPCRRNAPRPTPDSADAYWPLTEAHDWCGEHQLRLDTPAAEGADSTPAPRGP